MVTTTNILGCVYVLWCEGTSRFKIGYSKNVGQRAMALQVASPFPLRVVAVAHGTVVEEEELHFLFRKFRTHSEWFDLPTREFYRLLRCMGVTNQQIIDQAYS